MPNYFTVSLISHEIILHLLSPTLFQDKTSPIVKRIREIVECAARQIADECNEKGKVEKKNKRGKLEAVKLTLLEPVKTNLISFFFGR